MTLWNEIVVFMFGELHAAGLEWDSGRHRQKRLDKNRKNILHTKKWSGMSKCGNVGDTHRHHIMYEACTHYDDEFLVHADRSLDILRTLYTCSTATMNRNECIKEYYPFFCVFVGHNSCEGMIGLTEHITIRSIWMRHNRTLKMLIYRNVRNRTTTAKYQSLRLRPRDWYTFSTVKYIINSTNINCSVISSQSMSLSTCAMYTLIIIIIKSVSSIFSIWRKSRLSSIICYFCEKLDLTAAECYYIHIYSNGMYNSYMYILYKCRCRCDVLDGVRQNTWRYFCLLQLDHLLLLLMRRQKEGDYGGRRQTHRQWFCSKSIRQRNWHNCTIQMIFWLIVSIHSILLYSRAPDQPRVSVQTNIQFSLFTAMLHHTSVMRGRVTRNEWLIDFLCKMEDKWSSMCFWSISLYDFNTNNNWSLHAQSLHMH